MGGTQSTQRDRPMQLRNAKSNVYDELDRSPTDPNASSPTEGQHALEIELDDAYEAPEDRVSTTKSTKGKKAYPSKAQNRLTYKDLQNLD